MKPLRQGFRLSIIAAGSALVMLAASGSIAVGAPLIGRIPSSAAMFGAIDFAALRKSPLGGAATSAASTSDDAAKVVAFLTKAGIDPNRDLNELVFAVLPQEGDGPDEMAMLASGRFDVAKIRAAAIAEGAKDAKIGKIAAFRMPKPEGDKGLPLFLSFLDGAVMVGSAEATKAVHVQPQGSSSARRPADVPDGTAFWFAGDLGRVDAARAATASVPLAAQVQRVVLWGVLSDAVELHAIADATDAAVATQIAGFAQVAAGFAAMSQGPEAAALVSGLRVSAKDRRVTANLTLTKAQIAEMSATNEPPAAPTAAAPTPAVKSPAPKPPPAKSAGG